MKSSTHNIIEDLWYGSIDPLNGGLFKNNEITGLNEYIANHREDLEKNMTAEQKSVFEKYNDANSKLNGLCESVIFQCGFKLGAKLMLAVVTE